MAIKLDMSQGFRITDQTDVVNLITCEEKQLAEIIIQRYFDMECNADKSLVKHYPMDDMCLNEPAVLADKFLVISKRFWTHVLDCLQDNGKIDLSSHKKLGKIYTRGANRFYVPQDKEELRIYCFTFPSKHDQGNLEIMAEINLSVEFY